MHGTNIDFQNIAANALAGARLLLPELVPGSRFEGGEYVALNPSRADKRLGSFKINCRTGEWSDFATGAKGGDVVSWYAHAYGLKQGEAARRIAEKLGVSTPKNNGSKADNTELPPKIYSWGEEGPPTQYKELRRHYYPKDAAPKKKVKIKKPGTPKPEWVNCYRVFQDGAPVGWQWKKPTDYRDIPYFGRVRDPKRIFWTEGEKDADTLDALKLSALTFGGTGDGLPDGVDHYLKLIGERPLIVSTDNDAPGREHAQKKAAIAHACGIKHIHIFDPATVWPECPEGGDITDWFEKGGGTREKLIEIADALPDWQPNDNDTSTTNARSDGTDGGKEPPRPLIRELPPADPFPIDALGDVLGSAAMAIHERVRCPLAICGQSVIAAATLAIQAHADVELPTGHVRPISNFFVTIAETGERKTAADSEALWPVRKREKALREAYDEALPSYENQKIAWEKARDLAVKKAKGDRGAIEFALDTIGPSPTPPLSPMLTCPEPTYEGLCKYLQYGQPSVGVFSSEGGQFIGGHGMSDERKLLTATGLSGLWDGEPIKRVRAGDGALVLPGRRVAMHLMAQPDVAAILLSDQMLLSQGLLSRCLITAPESTSGTRVWREPSESADAAIKRYGARLLEVLERHLPVADGKANELAPRVLRLVARARELWIAFADAIENQLAPEGALSPVKGIANKLPEHAARLAGVLALVADVDTSEIQAEQMAAGITLAQHYVAEALRLFEASRVSDSLQLAQRLLTWLRGTWKEDFVSLPDIYQNGPNAIRDKATAARLVVILEDHGWLNKEKSGAEIAGNHRRNAWRIVGRP
jgi:hypothetical protein